MAIRHRSKAGKVYLRAYDTDGSLVETDVLSIDDYYDGSPPLIDSNEYRAERKIRSLAGEIYDYDGHLDQSFTARYTKTGKYDGGRSEFADGTVNED